MQQLSRLDKEAGQRLGPMINGPNGKRNQHLPGQVLRFSYSFFKPGHDPQPLIIVCGDYPHDGFLAGINLHYLTMPKAKMLILGQNHCDNPGFSYRSISSDAYIAGAYRTYHWAGVQQIQYENCKFLKGILSLQGILTPGQLSAIVSEIRRMANQQVVPVAGPTPEQPYQLSGAGPQPPAQ